ncbi:MAG: hypothetical protein WC277_08380 [Bacilli bacterium]|jgi:hypothetical protein
MSEALLFQYIEIALIILTIILAAIAWFFRSKANAMEKYVAANRATREFIDTVMISLEDLVVTEVETDEIKDKCLDMVAAIGAFAASLDNGDDPYDALDASTNRMTTALHKSVR